jgi:hypothetical protein
LYRINALALPGSHWQELISAPRSAGLVTVQAAISDSEAIADDWVTLLLGRVLPLRIWRVVTGNQSEVETFRCRRMTARRVDCAEAGVNNPHCDTMAAFIAGPDGVVRRGDYHCRHHRAGWIRRPHWSQAPRPTSPTFR